MIVARAPGEPFTQCEGCPICRDCGPRKGPASFYQVRSDECNECGDRSCPNSPRSRARHTETQLVVVA